MLDDVYIIVKTLYEETTLVAAFKYSEDAVTYMGIVNEFDGPHYSIVTLPLRVGLLLPKSY